MSRVIELLLFTTKRKIKDIPININDVTLAFIKISHIYVLSFQIVYKSISV